jgi:hypothetical protein
MRDHKTAYTSRAFKKDQYAWGVLFVLVLVYFWGSGELKKDDPIALKPWQGAVSKNASLTVLEFDRVVRKENESHVNEDQLRQQLKALDENGFEAVSIKDVFNFYYRDGVLPEKSLLLIFANGYLETYSVVDPVLREMQWPASIALITGPIVRRDTYFLYWDRLQNMVDNGIWDIVAAGHRSRERGTRFEKITKGIRALKVGKEQDEGEETGSENSLQNYEISKNLIEDYLSGYKTLAYFPRNGDSHEYIKNADLGYSESRLRNQFFKLGFVNSFVGINGGKSDPLRLRRLRVQPGWQPQTLLTLVNKAVQATAVSRPDATQKDSNWFTRKGELVETSGHPNILWEKTLWAADGNRSEALGTSLRGIPGASIFLPGGKRANNWILDANFRLDRGEFWIRQNSIQRGGEWRLGGDEKNLNLQYRVAHGKYKNLARSRKGVPLQVWHHLRVIKRGKGIIARLNDESLWNFPVHIPYELTGDIAIQVWSEDGEGALKLKNAGVIFFPNDIRWLEPYPQEKEVQLLIQYANRVSGVTTVTHRVQGKRLESVAFDEDLFRILTHRYGWEFIPTIRLGSDDPAFTLLEERPGKTGDSGESILFWMSRIQILVEKNHWTQVHLDLSENTTEKKSAWFDSLSQLQVALGKLDCSLLVTTGGRPPVRKAIEVRHIL